MCQIEKHLRDRSLPHRVIFELEIYLNSITYMDFLNVAQILLSTCSVENELSPFGVTISEGESRGNIPRGTGKSSYSTRNHPQDREKFRIHRSADHHVFKNEPGPGTLPLRRAEIPRRGLLKFFSTVSPATGLAFSNEFQFHPDARDCSGPERIIHLNTGKVYGHGQNSLPNRDIRACSIP